METSITEINIEKLQISLMDCSVWMLSNAGDISKISIWYPPQRIKIEEKENGQYTLTNLDTYDSETIKVSRVV